MRVLDDLYRYDLRLLLWCHRSRFYPTWMSLVKAISRSGDGHMQVVFPLLVLLIAPRGYDFLLLTLFAYSCERPLYFVLKNTLKRRRPPEIVPGFTSVVKASDRFSFPSGHTMAAFLLAGLGCLFFGSAALPLYLWATAVGISRVILGVHFPTDILAGALLGTALAFWSIQSFTIA